MPASRGSNRLFLDTAVESEWHSLLPLGIFHGITTNPTLLERAGHECTVSNVQRLASQALSIKGCDEFMCQAWGTTCDEMYRIGMALSELDRERVVVKVPVTAEGTKAAAKLMKSGVRICLTACYSSQQAIIAAALGVEYIAPYLGRMTDNGKDGMYECRKMQEIVNGMNSPTRILVASIRDVKSMTDLIRSGMDTFTFNPDIARALFDEPLTDQAASDFEAAALRCGGYVDKDHLCI
jgi:transaldolase